MIQVKNYRKAFGNRVLVEDSSFVFEDDKLYALVGESGCGKTTFLRNLSQLDPNYEGSILVDQVPFEPLKPKDREKRRSRLFSYVFSDANLLEYLSVRENAELSSFLVGQRIDHDQEKDLIDFLGLDGIWRENVTTLSAGEQQRVAILRALLTERKYLICDEPTAHLDPANAKRTTELLQRISHEMKKTVIIALHDYSYLSLFDSVLQIRNQRLTDYEQK